MADWVGRALGLGDDYDAEALEPFRALAWDEWLRWIRSERRPDSIAELERSRIVDIFLVRGDLPTVEKLVEEFGIPEGRAVAMMSRFRYGHARAIREKEVGEVAAKIARLLDQGDPTATEVDLTLTRNRARVCKSLVLEREEELERLEDAAGRTGGTPGGDKVARPPAKIRMRPNEVTAYSTTWREAPATLKAFLDWIYATYPRAHPTPK